MIGNVRRAVFDEMRKRIIGKSSEGISAKDISIILDINYKTMFRIIKIFYSTGRIEAKGRGGDNRVRVIQNSNLEQKQIILLWVYKNCLLYQKLIFTNLIYKYKSHFDCKESHFDWETLQYSSI